MNAKQSHEQYDDTYRNVGADTDAQEAFVIGQLLKNPGQVFEPQIADLRQQIQDATEAGDNSEKICALHFELRHLRMVQIEAEGVHRNSHSDSRPE